MTEYEEVALGTAQLLDVRTLEEWQSGHAEYAIHIPVDALLSGERGVLDSTKKIYVYCAGGGRASVAVNYLVSEGFEAINIGGLQDWINLSK